MPSWSKAVSHRPCADLLGHLQPNTVEIISLALSLHSLFSVGFPFPAMAAEFVGGAMLSAFLQVAFDRLASHDIVDYFRGRKLNETLLKRLNIMLLSINAVVDDAEAKHIRNPYVKAWLDEVKDAVHEAEDVLDEIDTEVNKCKLEGEFNASNTSSKVWNFFSASVVSSFDKEIESRVTELLDNLEYLASKKDMLGLKEGCGVGVGSGMKVSQRLPTTCLVDEAGVYGRDDDKIMIIEWLLSDNENGNHPSIISIVGMGGIGKTTLAQLVYNDQKMKGEFDLKAWVCVSEEFDVIKITRSILEAITLSPDNTTDMNMLQVKLKEKLTGKRFLLVLDDIWNENRMHWEALQVPFNYGDRGSKILVTTRSDKVASTVRSLKIHHLKQLQEEDCWMVFAKHAFHDGNPQLSSGLEEIGRKIIKKCKGLPLALRTVGSVLYAKLSYGEWNSVLTSEIWDMSEDESNILPALRLSYHYLPSHLKRCFAYCSLFPKDYKFDKEQLVMLWMAENFIQFPQQNKRIEEVGDQYFHDLVSRSFFQRASGNGSCFVMHDLLCDLANYVSGEFCFRLEAEKAQRVTKLTRHFSYVRFRYESCKRFEDAFKANKLRTFLPLSMYQGKEFDWMSRNLIHDLLSRFKCLRVLSLSGYYNIIELPDSICNQKHLRYLDLSGTAIRKLPDSICFLYNLQILKLMNCLHLDQLPLDLHKLINLRLLDFRKTKVRKVPMHLGTLKNLQVLTSFYVGKCSESSIKQLRELNCLRGTLSIVELQNVVYPMDALAANLENKIHIEELMLEWSMNNKETQNEREVLEKLRPHKNLKKLSIRYYGGTRFPDWFGDYSLSNVVSLNLSNCKYCFLLPPLGLLPSLKALSVVGLDGIVAIGPEFYHSSSSTSTIPFVSLEILKFQDMVEWEGWDSRNVSGAFPLLQELYIQNCPKLKENLPEHLPSLMKLVIIRCQQLVALVPRAPAIHDVVLEDCDKVQLKYLVSTLKVLRIGGSCMEGSTAEKIEHSIANAYLEALYISDGPSIEFPIRHCHNFLVCILIESSCESLRTFPLDLFPKLQKLYLERCINLEMVSALEGHDHNVTSLTMLQISYCPNFVSFPKGGLSAPRLEWCHIACLENLKSLPERMHILLPSLRNLIIRDCPQLEPFLEGGLPSHLNRLSVHNCPKLFASRMKWGLHIHSSLVHLAIGDANVESLPDQGLLPPTLTSLSFYKCSNLRTLDYMGLCHLSSLKELRLGNCPRLQCLPEEGLPSSLSTLVIVGNTPLLKQRCQKQKGEDWGKIAHVACVRIDDDIIT